MTKIKYTTIVVYSDNFDFLYSGFPQMLMKFCWSTSVTAAQQ